MLSRETVAEELGVCTKTVDNLIRRQEIKAVKLGRRVLIPEGALTKLLEGLSWDVR